ncbi:hypothetical protein H8B15_09110 [Hymenobacter sp. BT507]|uniref:DUF892 family protein n=1 Tax=Hymenobacter citatus TaxID=2763506 RepID=A0ABR7MJ43_9BACT|nr:hypothetical protein [Hymenobacter citatus]MBC6611081.1 hypothetical protein [Hymenobacter citatus]
MEQENAKKPLAQLTKEDAQQLFVRLFTSSVTNNPTLLNKLEGMGSDARDYGEKLGKQVAIVLIRDCPAGQALLMKLGGDEVSRQQAVSDKEVQVLRPIAAVMCQDMQPRIAEMKKMSAAQRLEVLSQLFEKNLKPHAAELSELYGADVFLDSQRMKTVGIKIAAQMSSQCSDALMLFVDLEKIGQ